MNGNDATILQGNAGSATGAVISGDITLPDDVDNHPVTGIADNTVNSNGTNNDFTSSSNWKTITGITFPTTLTSIGDYAFSNATTLTKITFENPLGWKSITHIGACAFNRDGSGKDNSLAIDGLDLSGLTDTSIAPGIFRWQCGLTGAVTLPEGITSIGESAFSQTSVTSVNFDKLTQLTSIAQWAFDTPLTPNLKSVDLSNSNLLTYIGFVAFYNNKALTSLKLPTSAPSLQIDYNAFTNCDIHGDLTIPATAIGNQAFLGNASLRSFTLTGTSLNTGYSVFGNCFGLEYIDMSTVSTFTGVTTLSRAGSMTAGHTFGNMAALLASTAVADNVNYVLNGQRAWLYVQDGCDYYIPHAFIAAKATWNAASTGAEATPNATRANFGKLATAYLPFDFTLPATSGLQGFTLLDKKNTPEHVFRFKQQAATYQYKANTPYVIRNAGGAAKPSPEATGTVSVPTTPIGKIQYAVDGVTTSYTSGLTAVQNPNSLATITDQAGGTWGFYDTTEAVDNSSATAWKSLILQANAWYDLGADAASPLSPLRTFLATSDGAVGAKPVFEYIDISGNLIGEITSIGGIGNDESTNSMETCMYNISGQYLGKDLNALPRGIYIVNGKKIIKN